MGKLCFQQVDDSNPLLNCIRTSSIRDVGSNQDCLENFDRQHVQGIWNITEWLRNTRVQLDSSTFVVVCILDNIISCSWPKLNVLVSQTVERLIDEGHEVFHGKSVRVDSTVQLRNTHVHILSSTRDVAVLNSKSSAFDVELLLFAFG